MRKGHTFKFGGEFRIDTFNNLANNGATGTYNFVPAQTGQPSTEGQNLGGGTIGHSYASFLLGLTNNASMNNPTSVGFRRSSWAAFVQDSWKVTPKLTLELGLRYDGILRIAETAAYAELSRSSLGLAELAQRYLRQGENLLVLVDQFEELFRYHKEPVRRDEREASAAFVKLLLTAVGRFEVPVPDLDHLQVFVVLTMHSDYLGKISQFRGFPEALNDSQHLVPRMSRE